MTLTEQRQRLETLRGQMKSDRASFDTHWRELSDFLLPRRSRFLASDRNKGDKRNQNIIDSTARFAVRTLQSGLHAGLTSPARPWFLLTTADPDIAERQDVRVWLELVTRRMRVVFEDSNLYNTLPTIYGDMGVFGTAAMGVFEDSPDVFRCYAYPVGSYYIGLDRRNLVTTFSRDYELTVRQVVEEFLRVPGSRDIDWSKASPSLKDEWDRSNYETAVPITWVVLPNPEWDDRRLAASYKQFASYHYESSGRSALGFLRKSGYDTFPIMCPRWDITAEDAYGTACPGMDALGDVKQLQSMQREKAKALKKIVDPPLVGATELRTQKVSILPGDITYARDPASALRAAHEINFNLDHFRLDVGETQFRIQRAFYEDLFLMLARSDSRLGAARPTAREIEERHEEKLLALGPVLERTNDELLNPLIDRIFGIMLLHGLVPPAPDSLQGMALKVEYVSIMAQAQKLVGVAAQDRFVMSVLPLAQIDATVIDRVDTGRVVQNYADQLGIDPRSLRDDETVAAMAAERQQQQQAIVAAEAAQKMGAGVKALGTTPADQDSVLSRLASNLSGAVPALGGGGV